MKEDSKMRLVKSILLLMIFFGLFMACNGQKKAAMEVSNEEVASESPLKLIVEGNYAPAESAETQVITSEKGLSKFFRKINLTRKPGIPMPKIDFSSEMVLIYCTGVTGNGKQPRLLISEESDSEFIIEMHTVEDAEKPASTVSPFRIYTMPLTKKEIRFKAIK